MAPQYPSFWDSNQQLYHLSTCLKAWNATAALSVTSFAKLINSGLWLSDCGQQLYTGAGRTRGPRHLFPQSTPQQRSSCKKFPKSTTCGHRIQKKKNATCVQFTFFLLGSAIVEAPPCFRASRGSWSCTCLHPRHQKGTAAHTCQKNTRSS